MNMKYKTVFTFKKEIIIFKMLYRLCLVKERNIKNWITLYKLY
jgi:hypothetical protein